MKRQKSASILASIVFLAGTTVALAQHQHGQHKKDSPDTKQDKKGPKLPLCPVMGETVEQREGVSQGGGCLCLSAGEADRLRAAFRQMDLLLASEEPETGLSYLLALLRELRSVERAIS